MKTFSRYLSYRLREGALRTLIFTVLSVMICQIGISNGIDRGKVEYRAVGLYMLATALCITASIVPLFELSGLKNRRNLDTLYFFPIKREKMALVHYVSGFLQVAFIYTVTYVVAFVYLCVNTDYFALSYMIPYYFLSMLLALIIYSVYMFLFIQANTVADGVLFCVLWIFLPAFVGMVLVAITRENLFGDQYFANETYKSLNRLPSWGILYTPVNNLTVLYQDLIEINRAPTAWGGQVKRIMEHAYMFYVWGAVGVAAAVGYVVSFVKKGAEQAGEISSSWFGYRTLIPLYAYGLMLLINEANAMTLLIYLIIMVTGYIIYRRGFKFKVSDIIVSAAGLLFILLGSAL